MEKNYVTGQSKEDREEKRNKKRLDKKQESHTEGVWMCGVPGLL